METTITRAVGASGRTGRPRIYVACLAAYNAGWLHGAWIEVAEATDIWAAVAEMLAASPVPDAEEWAIHDYEGFEGAHLSEYASFDKVCQLAEFIEEHGRLGAKLYCHFGDSLDEARAALEDHAGEYSSLAGFAEEITRETGPEIPTALQYYINWEVMARDLELNGDVFTITLDFNQVHVFWNRCCLLYTSPSPRDQRGSRMPSSA